MTRSIPPGRRSAELRRDLGPVAWCALECLVERSTDARTSEASVRAVAAELGVAKNTAHRALAALCRAGLVTAAQARTADGRFRSGCYRLHLDAAVAASPGPNTRRRRPKPAAGDGQLQLLGDE